MWFRLLRVNIFSNAFNLADFCLRLEGSMIMCIFIRKPTLLLAIALTLFHGHGYQANSKECKKDSDCPPNHVCWWNVWLCVLADPEVVTTLNCNWYELRMISNKDECERKATLLGLADTSASVVHDEQRPYGCIYATNDWLGMNTALSCNVCCGSTDSGFRYSCICERECKAIGSKCRHSDECCIRHCS